MKIRKIEQAAMVLGKINNTKTDSDIETYSCNYINDLEGGGGKNVELISVSDSEPSTYKSGDKYYNTIDKKIHTADSSGFDVGVDPTQGIFYVVLSECANYYWSGSEMVAVGGGADDVVISSEQPTTDDWKIWIDPTEVETGPSNIEIGDKIMEGSLTLARGKDLIFTPDNDDNDNGDIVFYYNNGQEKCRIYSPNTMDNNNPYLQYRSFDKNGNMLSFGNIPFNGAQYAKIDWLDSWYTWDTNWSYQVITNAAAFRSAGAHISRPEGHTLRIEQAGYYMLSAQLQTMCAEGDCAYEFVYIKPNGTEETGTSQYQAGTGNWIGFNITDMKYFEVGTVVYLRFMSNKAGDYRMLSGNFIMTQIG